MLLIIYRKSETLPLSIDHSTMLSQILWRSDKNDGNSCVSLGTSICSSRNCIRLPPHLWNEWSQAFQILYRDKSHLIDDKIVNTRKLGRGQGPGYKFYYFKPTSVNVWRGTWRSGYGVGLATERSQVRVPATPLYVTTLGKLFTYNVPLFTKQYKLVPATGWEGNCRSGVDSVVYPPTGSMAWEMEMSTPPKLHSEYYYDIFTFIFRKFRTGEQLTKYRQKGCGQGRLQRPNFFNYGASSIYLDLVQL